jgi:hypothetical protein
LGCDLTKKIKEVEIEEGFLTPRTPFGMTAGERKTAGLGDSPCGTDQKVAHYNG